MNNNLQAMTNEILLAAFRQLVTNSPKAKRGEPRQRHSFALRRSTRQKLDELAQMTGSSRTELIERSVSEMHQIHALLS